MGKLLRIVILWALLFTLRNFNSRRIEKGVTFSKILKEIQFPLRKLRIEFYKCRSVNEMLKVLHVIINFLKSFLFHINVSEAVLGSSRVSTDFICDVWIQHLAFRSETEMGDGYNGRCLMRKRAVNTQSTAVRLNAIYPFIRPENAPYFRLAFNSLGD